MILNEFIFCFDHLVNIRLSNETNNETWIIVNLMHAGFYRVNYDEHNWNLLIKQLNTKYDSIKNINRAQMLDDSFNLGRAEILDISYFLRITEYLKTELNPMPFIAAFSGLNYIGDMLATNLAALRLFRVSFDWNNYFLLFLNNRFISLFCILILINF
jgi:hypothetical protein